MRAMKKFRDASGASMVLALVIMMAVSVICVSVLKIASSAPVTAYAQQDLEQSYLASNSAARLVTGILTDSSSVKAKEILATLDDLGDTGTKTFDLNLTRVSSSPALSPSVEFPKTAVTLTKHIDTTNNKYSVSVSFAESANGPVQLLSATSGGYRAEVTISTDVEIWTWTDGNRQQCLYKMYPPRYTGAPEIPNSLANDYANNPDMFTIEYKSAPLPSAGNSGDSGNSNPTIPARKWVRWLNGDGAILCSQSYTGDAAPTATPLPEGVSAPTKAADAEWWSYKFTGWTQPANTTSSVITYKPIFAGNVRRYTVRWLDVNGQEITREETKSTEGENTQTINGSGFTAYEPKFTGTLPTKQADNDGWAYEFHTWDAGTFVNNVKTYQSKFGRRINWLNENNNTLYTTLYEEGMTTEPSFSGETPTKTADANGWEYKFDNWDEGRIVNGVKTYTPQFSHTIQWLDVNNTLIETKAYAGAGAEPTFTGATPTKAEDEWWTYAFQGWDSGTIDGSVKTYKPIFTPTAKEYTVEWQDTAQVLGGNVVLKTATYTVSQGDYPSPIVTLPDSDDTSFYTYSNPIWSGPTIDTEEQTITYTLNVTKTEKKTRTVTWLDGNGTEFYKDTCTEGPKQGEYPEIAPDYSKGYPTKGAIILEETTFVEYAFPQSTDWRDDWVKTVDTETAIVYTPKFTETFKCSQVIWYDSSGNAWDRTQITETALENYEASWTAHAEPSRPDEYKSYTFSWHQDSDTNDGTTNNHRVVKYVPTYTAPNSGG